ncbi:hypothetical protein L210DRAFT_1020678 [Boletus edulis BED1]|uniref:Uncharacterized protein n=1 Tax=Boletus edulis BED1 TaxID=1328754 RepID=A0AAD4GCF3_BOLED|nr:hypothetical protein L210DRAFT_1020678 [Boletus edulis BED1]
MPGGSPTAFLLWSILATLFYCFHLFHLWSYDRFQCLKWNQSGRQPGAFKRFMSYTYLATLSCLVCFGVAFTFLKFREGFIVTPSGQITPVPLEYYSPQNKKWVLPLLLVFSVAWGCELQAHSHQRRRTSLTVFARAEFTFWLFLQNQGPTTRLWFESCEFKFWLWGTLFALIGMPLTTFVSRRQLDLCLAWTLLVGSSASTVTSLAFLYVLSRFSAFIRRVKDDGAAPAVVLRLVFFYQLNVGRIIYRFLFSVPLFVLSLDALQGSHTINNSTFWPDFLLMLGGIGAFVSSSITLLIFFPRSLTQELGYNVTTTAKPHATTSFDLTRHPDTSNQRPASPKGQVTPIFRSSSEPRSSHSGHDASPEYEVEDPSNTARPDSLEGNFPMHSWHPHDGETPSSESYIFDRRSRSLVRSRSEGHTSALHPYVRHFF